MATPAKLVELPEPLPPSESRSRRLYHFTAARWALDDLSRNRLKISRFTDLNDPFELLGARFADERVMRFLISDLQERYGLLCFSRNWSDPVLWSHYAHRHTGMCLGFDIPEELETRGVTGPALIDVEYVPSPRLLRGDDLIERVYRLATECAEPPTDVVKRFEAYLRAIFGTKMDSWRYEREVRILTTLETVENGRYYKYFDRDLMLREVVLGLRCEVSPFHIASLLQAYAGTVAVIKARRAPNSFRVVGYGDVTQG